MKIVLFGKNGQVGSEIDRQARELKFNIISFGREEGDITDFDKIRTIIKKEQPDVVINASAYHVVPDCETFPQTAFEINASAVKNLAEVSEENNIKLVHYSTDYVFDGLKRKPYKEYETPNPLQMYGISKLAGEYAALRYCRKSLVVRGAYIYGGKTGSRSKKGNFVLTILKQIEGKNTLEVSSDQIVSPTYAADLAHGTLALIQKKESNGIYHLINEGSCSLAEFASQIVKESRSKTKIVPVERGGVTGLLHRPTFSVLQNTRAKQEGVVLPQWKKALAHYIHSINDE